MAHTLILLRHGESDWNQKNLFTGWVDVDLTDKGRAEAARGGQLLKDAGILPDVVHTSVLRRAITTANLALDAADRHWIPVRRSWRLNERHYGALQGLDKAATRDKYGDAQFMLWRRSFDTPPPPIEAGSEFDQTSDPRYAGVDVPLTECLADVIPRMMPYWENDIQADLRDGKVVLVTAHGNSLRALVKHLDGISDEDIAGQSSRPPLTASAKLRARWLGDELNPHSAWMSLASTHLPGPTRSFPLPAAWMIAPTLAWSRSGVDSTVGRALTARTASRRATIAPSGPSSEGAYSSIRARIRSNRVRTGQLSCARSGSASGTSGESSRTARASAPPATASSQVSFSSCSGGWGAIGIGGAARRGNNRWSRCSNFDPRTGG